MKSRIFMIKIYLERDSYKPGIGGGYKITDGGDI